MPNMARYIICLCNSVYHKIAFSNLNTILEIFQILNRTQTNINYEYQMAATSVHSVCISVEIFTRSRFCISAKEYPIL